METIKKKKILIIEDEYSLQEILKDILTDAGFDVIIANDGKEGIQKIHQEYPDIVLLDCMMPKMDGYEVIIKIRKDTMFLNLPVIMLTVKSSEKDQIKGINLGVDDYIIKPFNRRVMIAKIKTILERKEISVSANPLTQLPGNVSIHRNVQEKLLKDIPFALLYIDLANFKSYNDYYGFQKGDEMIKHTGNILVSAVKQCGARSDFTGHIGGDDFVVITTPERYKKISEKIIEMFDNSIGDFYSHDDRKRGYINTTDRQGNLQKFPVMTITIACVSTSRTKITHYAQISEIASGLKKYAKRFNKSIFVEEKRE